MNGAVFTETLKQNWKQTIYWGIGLGAMVTIVVLMVPFFDGAEFVKLVESLPPALMRAAGVGDDASILATTEGFIAVGFFGKLALIFAVFPIVMGLKVISNEEDDGIMDSVLSLPIDRKQLIVEKFLAFMVMNAVVVVMIFIGLWIGVQAVSVDVEVNMQPLTDMVIQLMPILSFLLAVTIFVGALIPNRTLALGILTAFVVASFMIQTVGSMVEGGLGEAITASFVFQVLQCQRYSERWV